MGGSARQVFIIVLWVHSCCGLRILHVRDATHFAADDFGIVTTFPCEYPEPVLYVKVEYCPVTGKCFFNAPTMVKKEPSNMSHFARFQVRFKPLCNGIHRLHIQMEYTSKRAALRDKAEVGDTPSYVGTVVQGSPFLVDVNSSAPKLCKNLALDFVSGKPCKSLSDVSGAVLDGIWGPWQLPFTAHGTDSVAQGSVLWRPRSCYPQLLTFQDVRARLEAKCLLLVGDSVMEQVYDFLRHGLQGRSHWLTEAAPAHGTDMHLQYFKVKGVLPKTLSNMTQFLRTNRSSCKLAFNPAGLWQAAYGNISDWQSSLPALMKVVSSANKLEQTVVLGSTQVHPELFLRGPWQQKNGPPTPPEVARKWALTAPRVRLLNDILRSEAAAVKLPFLDLGHMTHKRDDDAKFPSDMRHYGQATISMIANLIVGVLYPE
eukprot:gnl/TRDRNA2_/TRDRNA2_81059_c0_seq1.p1 gnl/TRDRNA2_/TRDRNA2_81059_c0~~gnl/TRDRNA2_/TRDRNA2_81059_c0_seq1.p1  ORF type:complete len:429 (-),score=40.08 gnl/TRDRNA2_/TRDRNA2_81059_c0_seq1:31-1317(-)